MPTRVRWLAVVLCILYGFAKLNGSQFTVLDSELTKPLGQVSGFWLTWYYFGYSPAYGAVIALIQVGGGVLLALRRTALPAALLLVPVFVNIILIDVCFGVDLGATVVAVIILGCLVAVIAPHAAALKAAVVPPTAPSRLTPRLAALAALIASAYALTWWMANDNNRAPTKIDGIWSVRPAAGAPQPPWRRVFFEYNRAHMAVFRSSTADETHHFEIDDGGTVRVWQTWLRKDALIMQGRLGADGRIEISPVGAGPPFVLERDYTGAASWR